MIDDDLRHLLFVAILAKLEVVLVVTGRIAPLDIGLDTGGRVTGRRRQRVRLMAVAAFRDVLGLLRVMRHVPVRGDLFSAGRYVACGRRSEFIIGAVAIQASLLGSCRRLTEGLGYTEQRSCDEQEHPDP